MTSKEFYADFFGVKNPNEQGTTLNISVWKYAEAYAKALNQGQKLPMAGVGETFYCLNIDYGVKPCKHQCDSCKGNGTKQ